MRCVRIPQRTGRVLGSRRGRRESLLGFEKRASASHVAKKLYIIQYVCRHIRAPTFRLSGRDQRRRPSRLNSPIRREVPYDFVHCSMIVGSLFLLVVSHFVHRVRQFLCQFGDHPLQVGYCLIAVGLPIRVHLLHCLKLFVNSGVAPLLPFL